MKALSILGVVLILAGIAALVYQGIGYTTRETVLDIGPITATAHRERTLPLPPIVGLVALAAGVSALYAGSRRQAA